MQTFLPVADFAESAQMLDYKRLGKQRVEGMQLLNAMQPDYPHKGWLSHPAKIMWEGYENALKEYVNTMITQWKARGYNNNKNNGGVNSNEVMNKSAFGLRPHGA